MIVLRSILFSSYLYFIEDQGNMYLYSRRIRHSDSSSSYRQRQHFSNHNVKRYYLCSTPSRIVSWSSGNERRRAPSYAEDKVALWASAVPVLKSVGGAEWNPSCLIKIDSPRLTNARLNISLSKI
jgi:hypothetical protein